MRRIGPKAGSFKIIDVFGGMLEALVISCAAEVVGGLLVVVLGLAGE
jgi:hypothetical protein